MLDLALYVQKRLHVARYLPHRTLSSQSLTRASTNTLQCPLPNTSAPLMQALDPDKARVFAVDVVEELRSCGYEAVWAGGCVRDQLLGKEPKDYDVATNATPDQVREVFGKGRTILIGAAFGVITVLGPRSAGQIEVATFRRDAIYSDGRHPDSVAFSNAEEDALRRDFTINGLFFDPITKEVIDYVGGQTDLQQRVLRAIRDPEERIEEDKLRMLRAVRFAATFAFEIDPSTMSAIQRHADELQVVSAERIAAELRRMLTHDNRRRAAELLRESGLLSTILPELDIADEAWQETLRLLEAVSEPTTSVVFALLLRPVHVGNHDAGQVEHICRRWKLSNEEIDGVLFCLDCEATIRSANAVPWPTLQRLLIAPRIKELMRFCEAVALIVARQMAAIDYCSKKLALPPDELNPSPLLDGDTLRSAGLPPGPIYKRLLSEVRDAQLEGTVSTPDEALELAKSLANATDS